MSDTDLSASGLTLLDASNEVYTYARPSPGPALLVPTAEAVTEPSMWRRIADPAWDPRQTAAVTGLRGAVHGGPGQVRQRAAGSDGDVWDVDAPSGGFLRVSGNDDPGWHATVDGRSAQVHLADGTFRGVVVPPGRHRVSFSFANPSERTGRVVGGASVVVLLALAAWPGRGQRFSRKRTGASGAGTAGPATAARSEPNAPRGD